MRPFAVFAGASKDSIALKIYHIQLLESPIPAAAPAAAPSQKASSDDILGTKHGTIDPLMSKRPEKIMNKKIQNSKKKKNVENGQKWSKMVKNGQKWSKWSKWSKMVQNGSKWSKMVKNGEKWSKSPKMVKIAKNGQKGLKSSKMFPYGLKWSKIKLVAPPLGYHSFHLWPRFGIWEKISE